MKSYLTLAAAALLAATTVGCVVDSGDVEEQDNTEEFRDLEDLGQRFQERLPPQPSYRDEVPQGFGAEAPVEGDDREGPDPTPWELDANAGPDPTPWRDGIAPSESPGPEDDDRDDYASAMANGMGPDPTPWQQQHWEMHEMDEDEEPDPQPWVSANRSSGKIDD